jgi:hypothetical protein
MNIVSNSGESAKRVFDVYYEHFKHALSNYRRAYVGEYFNLHSLSVIFLKHMILSATLYQGDHDRDKL